MVKVQAVIRISEKLLNEITKLSEENNTSKSQMANDLLEIGMDNLEDINTVPEDDEEEKFKFAFSIERPLKREIENSSENHYMKYTDFLIQLIKIGLKHIKNPPSINENSLANITSEQLESNVGVYSITNTITERMYITGSKNILHSIYRLRNDLERGLNRNKMFQEEFNKYGIEAYIIEFLRECPEEQLESYAQDYRLMNIEKVYPLDRGSDINIYNVNKAKSENTAQGYIWSYRYKEQGKLKFMNSVNLYGLKKKVLDRGLDWVEYDDEAKELVDKDKEKYLNNEYIPHDSSNKSGFYRVHLSKLKNKSPAWVYSVYDDNKLRKIQSKNIYELKMKVLDAGFEWKELTKEARQLIREEKEKYSEDGPIRYSPRKTTDIENVYKTNPKNRAPAWVYSYFEEDKVKRIQSKNLYELKKRIISEGLEWKELTENGKQLVEEAKKEYLDPNYKKINPPKKSIFYRVRKDNVSQKYSYWVYSYKVDGKTKTIRSKNVYELKMKVLEAGLEWEELTDEAKEIIENAKKEFDKSNYNELVEPVVDNSMISPKLYVSFLKDEPLDKLLKERDELISEMNKFENNKKDNLDDFIVMSPSPETQYQVSFLYLAELCKVISERLND